MNLNRLRYAAFTCAVLSSLTSVTSLVVDCKGSSSPAVITGDIKVTVDGACQTITAIVPDATVQLVCVTAEEVAELAALIGQQFGLETDAGGFACVSVQGRSLCTTPEHMREAIDAMNARRAARKDGGK